MPIFAITYDLNREKDYKKLFGELERLNCQRVARSFWLADLNATLDEVFRHVEQYLDNDDRLIVVETTRAGVKTRKALKGTCDWMLEHAVA